MSVLDAVIRMRELEQQQAQKNVDNMMQGAQLFADRQKTSMLAELQKQSQAQDLYTKGFSLNPETGQPEVNPEAVSALSQIASAKKTGLFNIADYNPQDVLKATTLARKIGGVRGVDKLVPSILQEMGQGKTIDQIDDEMRFANQSEDFQPYRKAMQSATSKLGDKGQTAMDYFDDYVQSGDKEGALEYMKKVARDNAPADTAQQVNGRELALNMLDEIESDMDALEKAGVDTNIFTGKYEDIMKRVGGVANPKVRELANKILTTMQSYRLDITGKVFNESEMKEYRQIFPSTGYVKKLNTANINALRSVLEAGQSNFYRQMIGAKEYNKLFGSKKSTGSSEVDTKLSAQGFTPEQIAEYKRIKKIQ
jgi:tetratricopeptide (TPR) repeat protein